MIVARLEDAELYAGIIRVRLLMRRKTMKVGYVYDPVYLKHDTGKHVENILAKMGASSRTEAGVRAVKEELLD